MRIYDEWEEEIRNLLRGENRVELEDILPHTEGNKCNVRSMFSALLVEEMWSRGSNHGLTIVLNSADTSLEQTLWYKLRDV